MAHEVTFAGEYSDWKFGQMLHETQQKFMVAFSPFVHSMVADAFTDHRGPPVHTITIGHDVPRGTCDPLTPTAKELLTAWSKQPGDQARWAALADCLEETGQTSLASEVRDYHFLIEPYRKWLSEVPRWRARAWLKRFQKHLKTIFQENICL